MDSPVVSFLIVNYKVAELVHQAIQSIQKHVSTPYEIIVFDNASDDGSVEKLTDRYRHTRVIASAENIGFGRGNNEAYRYSKGAFIFLLNPDTILVDDSVDRMVRFMQDAPNMGLVSPRLLYEDGSLQRSIRKFYSFYGSLFDNRFMNPVIARFPVLTRWLPGMVNHHRSQYIDWAKGAALLIRREVIDQIGLFDPRFFIYGEEIDLCYRIGQAGWDKVYLNSCKIIHLEGKSTIQASARMFIMNYKGLYLFLKKHFDRNTLIQYHNRVWWMSRLLLLLSFRNEARKSLYKDLIVWHAEEGKDIAFL
ncbi:MAG: glycosyltransferase family 2 protein [Bacteroidota bacterium]